MDERRHRLMPDWSRVPSAVETPTLPKDHASAAAGAYPLIVLLHVGTHRSGSGEGERARLRLVTAARAGA